VPTFTRVRKGGEPAFQECPQSDLSHVQFIRAAMAKPIEALSLVKPPASKSFGSHKFRLFLLNRREGDNLDRRCGIARDFSRHYPSRDPQITERTRALPSAQRLRHNSSVPKRTRQIRLPLSSAHERAQNERKTSAKLALNECYERYREQTLPRGNHSATPNGSVPDFVLSVALSIPHLRT
jgi:hypothetical protein